MLPLKGLEDLDRAGDCRNLRGHGDVQTSGVSRTDAGALLELSNPGATHSSHTLKLPPKRRHELDGETSCGSHDGAMGRGGGPGDDPDLLVGGRGELS